MKAIIYLDAHNTDNFIFGSERLDEHHLVVCLTVSPRYLLSIFKCNIFASAFVKEHLLIMKNCFISIENGPN